MVGEARRKRLGGGDRVPAVGGDQRVRHGADAATPPPGRLCVGRDADRARHVSGPAIAGLYEPVIVPRGKEEDLLAARRLDDLAHVAHDQRAPRQAPEVDGLEVREKRVVARDRQHGLIGRDLIPFIERAHVEILPATLPASICALPARAQLQQGDRLVDAAERRVVLLEDLHRHMRVPALGLEQLLGEVEVRVAVPAAADFLDRQPEDVGVQTSAWP